MARDALKWKVCLVLLMAMACGWAVFQRVALLKSDNSRKPFLAQEAQDGMEKRFGEEWPPREVVDGLVDDKNRIVVVGANCGYLDLVDNLLSSMRQVGVKNFVIVPYDAKAHEIMSKLFPQHTLPLPRQIFGNSANDNGNSGAVDYFSEQFGDLTRARPKILRHFVEKGYTIFYSDTDAYWRKNAWKTIDAQLEAVTKKEEKEKKKKPPEILFSLDTRESTDAFSNFFKLRILKERVCSCFMYVAPTDKGLEFLQKWEQESYRRDETTGEYAQKDDQSSLYPIIRRADEMRNVSFDFLDMKEFPSGYQYNETKGLNPTVVHNNYIVGYDAKKERFQRWDAWRPTGLLDTIDPWTC